MSCKKQVVGAAVAVLSGICVSFQVYASDSGTAGRNRLAGAEEPVNAGIVSGASDRADLDIADELETKSDSTITGLVSSEDIPRLTKKQAEILVPRAMFKPVPTMDQKNEIPVDTIDTGDGHIKIILYADNTWKYWKDPAYTMKRDVFTNNWTPSQPNPYRFDVQELPERTVLWLVDSTSQYKCPRQVKVYSPFGYRHGRNHMGVDLPLRTGEPVYAAFSGKVRMSKYYRGYGNLIVIRHENGMETFYGHLSRRDVTEGQWVNAGDAIGLGGSTGRSTGPHLHFETRYKGYAFDPQWIIDFESGNLRSSAFVLKKKYLSARSKYVPESDEEEDEIMLADSTEYAEAAAKAAREKAEREAARYYKIKSGDTLGRIAINNGTTVSALCKLNGISRTTTLRVGRTIRVR